MWCGLRNGPDGEERFAAGEPAHRGVNAGRFEAFVGREWREDRWQPAGEHGFAAAGTAEKQEVVSATGGNDHRPLRELLPADVGEVHVVAVEFGLDLLGRRGDGIDFDGPGDDAHGLGEARDRVRFDFLNDGRFSRVLPRYEQFLDAQAFRRHRDRQGPADRPDGAVEGQFADGGVLRELLGQELPRGDEDTQGNGQVKGPALFADVGRCKVDDDAARGPRIAEIGEGPFDAVDALADGQLGHADEDDLGHARRGIDLGLDRGGVDPLQGEGPEFGEHKR